MRPWIRRGCFGCLGVVALLAVAGVVIVVISESAPEERRTASRDQALPQSPATDSRAALEAVAGTIEIDVSGAVLKVTAGPANEPIHLEADYDAGRFELSESMDVLADETWTYRLGFKRKRHFGFFGRGWTRNRLRLVVPREVLVRIVADVTTADSEFDLGGLAIDELRLGMRAGHHDVAFREPLSRPLGTMYVEGRATELAILGVGNASPRQLDIEQRAGKIVLDLRGAWWSDGEIYTSCRVGEIDVQFPENVILDVDGLDAPSSIASPGLTATGAAAEIAPPSVRAYFDMRLCRERRRVR